MIRRSVVWGVGAMFAALFFSTGLLPAKAADTERLSLKGYDPVAYFTVGAPTEGSPAYETVFDGQRYRFVSAANMTLFNSDPEKYAPQFAGSCANGVSRGLKVEANPQMWRIVDGKLYVFAGSKIPDQIDTNPVPFLEQARSNWKGLRDKPYQ
jgi:YHS domain-containing protein